MADSNFPAGLPPPKRALQPTRHAAKPQEKCYWVYPRKMLLGVHLWGPFPSGGKPTGNYKWPEVLEKKPIGELGRESRMAE